MSDILIRGMEMPKDVTLLAISPCGMVDVISGQPDLSYKTLRNKAISIPPHGRLVDASEMFVHFVIEGQKTKRYKIGERWALNGVEIRNVIDSLETIIPANKEEES